MKIQGNGILQIRLFGMFEVALNGAALIGLQARPRSQQLLVLLALHPNQAVSNEWLATQIWPLTASIDSLGHEVPILRREMGSHGVRLAAPRNALRLDTKDVEVDTNTFDTAWEAREIDAAALKVAAENYRGPLLQGWYDDWIAPFRSRYQVKYVKALRWLARHALTHEELPEAKDYLFLLLQSGDPAGPLHLHLMTAYMRWGQDAEAKQLYEAYSAYLLEEHHLLPSVEMTALFIRIPRARAIHVPLDPAQLSREADDGPVPLDSRYYIQRAEDAAFHTGIAQLDGIVVLRGPRQGGKTSLLARGLEQARQLGGRVIVTDFGKLGTSDLVTHEAFFLTLAHRLRKALALETAPEAIWDPMLGPNANFEMYVRDVALENTSVPILWAMDEADRLFDRPYRDEVFGLFRSWYNERALDPHGPWQRFTLLLTHSTEPHLYITNLHQSPFNVGTRAALDDFTREQVAELNTRYDSVFATESELTRLYTLLGGHPFLIRRGLDQSHLHGLDIATLEAQALCDGGIFREHLTHLGEALSRDPSLSAAIGGLLRGQSALSAATFSRLRAAGVVAGETPETARLRCGLYASYLRKYLG